MVRLNDYMIAGNTDTPLEVIMDLSLVGVVVIRERLAANCNTPADILEKLASDGEAIVRAAVAENSSLPRSVAERLSMDEHPDVRFSLSENIKTPMDLLRRLMEDDNPYVANAASKTMDILYFESMLTEQKFECEPGEVARLGELLVTSSWLDEDMMLSCVRQATSQRVPLGQVLLRTGLVPQMIVLNALKMQSSVRRGQISVSDAVQRLAEQKLNAA
jgi:hypothetical protein